MSLIIDLSCRHQTRSGFCVVVTIVVILASLVLSGCATIRTDKDDKKNSVYYLGEGLDFLDESPLPDAKWRGHTLSRCNNIDQIPSSTVGCLSRCAELFREGSGSDGMIELEMCLEQGDRHPLLLLTLGQLYLMAGRGEPALLPAEGPAADVGDWQKNKKRLLGRAEKLLTEAAKHIPDDAGVDYLLADVARVGNDYQKADVYWRDAGGKCTGGMSFSVMRQYQILNRYPAKMLAAGVPDYPKEVVLQKISGVVMLDLLIGPRGLIWQAVVIDSPAQKLSRAALDAFMDGQFQPARIGKYPVWSWIRVNMTFNLED